MSADRRHRRRRHVHRPVPLRRRRAHASRPRRCRRGAATRRRASSTACARSAACRRARSCTAPRSAPTRCWSGAGRRSASSRRAAFATCWRCAAATGAAPGACGATSRPIADRDMRLEVDRAHARRRHDPHGGRRRAKSARPRRRCIAQGAQAVAIIFINAYANAENERRALAARARGLAERLRHRLARGAVRDPRVRALLHRGDQRLSAAGRRLLHRQARSRAGAAEQAQAPHRAVERRHHVDRDRAQAAGSHRALRPGGRRGRGRGARARPRASTISSPAISAAPRSTCR